MAGLRERKKRERSKSIVEAARTLFIQRGFSNVTIEQIAELANVSPGTVYNAFASKTELLFEVFLSDIDGPVAKVRNVAANYGQAHDAIRRSVEIYLEWLDGYPKTLVRVFTASAIMEPNSSGQGYRKLDRLIFQCLLDTFQKLDAAACLRNQLTPEQCAQIVFNISNSEHYAWLMGDDCAISNIVDRIMEQVETLRPSMVVAAEDKQVAKA